LQEGSILFLTLILFFSVSGCRGEAPGTDPGLSLVLAISPTPPGVGPARLLITLRDTAGGPIEGARIEVEGNMSHAGMVPVLDTAQGQEPGRYTVPEFRFTMAGDWILIVRATLPDGRKTEIQKRTKVYSAPPGISSDTGTAQGPETSLDPGAYSPTSDTPGDPS
jgi:hypothetical protein